MSAAANWMFGLIAVGVVAYLVLRHIARRRPVVDDYPSENGDGSYP